MQLDQTFYLRGLKFDDWNLRIEVSVKTLRAVSVGRFG